MAQPGGLAQAQQAVQQRPSSAAGSGSHETSCSWSTTSLLSAPASAVLERFRCLGADKARLEARVLELERRLQDRPRRESGSQVDELERRLLECAVRVPRKVDLPSDVRCATLEDLQSEMDRSLSQLTFENGSVVRHTDVLELHLVAELRGGQYGIFERERIDGAGGGRRILKQAPQLQMHAGSDWREETRRALSSLLGLDSVWQEKYLHLEDASWKTSSLSEVSAQSCSEFVSRFGQLRTEGVLHHVTVHLESLEQLGDAEGFASLGLPLGCDFVTGETTEEGAERLHVWCWRSQKTDDDIALALLGFEKYLASLGVPVNHFGHGSMKTLAQLYAEVYTHKECSLIETNAQDNGARLIRMTSVLQIKLLTEVDGCRKMLKSSEQYLEDGRRRKVAQLLVLKLRPGDDWREVLPSAFEDRLGISQDVFDDCFELEAGTEECEEELRMSQGYPLQTMYRVWKATVWVVNPFASSLAGLGLPHGHSFVSKEGCKGSQRGRLHVWAWMRDDEDAADDEDFDGFGEESQVENIARELRAVEHLVRQTAGFVVAANMGLEMPLEQSLEKLQACLKHLTHIDSTGHSDFEVRRLFRRTKQLGGKPDSALMDYIKENFTKCSSQLSPNRNNRMSMASESPPIFSAPIEEPTFGKMSAALKVIRERIDTFDVSFLQLAQEITDSVFRLYGEILLTSSWAVLKVDMGSCRRFLQHIEDNYYDNPYHNSMHAAQVCHAGVWFSITLGLADKQRTLERTAFVIAALCHDLKHFGRNNAFCVSSGHALAVLYNDTKVLENMHAATCIQALLDFEAGGLTTNMLAKDKQKFREIIIELILATDMSEHFQAISKARLRRDAADFSLDTDADRRFVAQVCLKGGDICHSALSWDFHIEWSQRIQQEFFAQGDEESRLGLPISALCDRSSLSDLGRSQRGFIEFVCAPLFEELGRFMGLLSQPEKENDEADGNLLADGMPSAIGEMTVQRSLSGSYGHRQSFGGSRRISASRSLANAACPSIIGNTISIAVVSVLYANAERWSADDEAVRTVVDSLRVS